VPHYPALKTAGRRVLAGSFPAESLSFHRLVEDCPNCSSTNTKPLSYHANTFPYWVYECSACAHVWRFLQADASHLSKTITPLRRLIPKSDRRQADRLPVQMCPACRVTNVPMATVARTDAVLHFRCDTCGHVRMIAKPGGNHSYPGEHILPTIRGRRDPARASGVSTSLPSNG
jgi:Zn ribbon nucleic-acid-binding protein